MRSKIKKSRAIFLDRDGTINREVDVLRRIGQLKILPGAAGAIKKINELGYLAIVITNQPVIARGWLSEQEVDHIHGVLITRLAKRNAKIDAIYYCPHHPNANLKKYRLRCSCRKPGTKLVKMAIKKFHIDAKQSFMVGDSTRDILTGKRMGLTTILVGTGYAGNDGKYEIESDFIAKDLRAAAKIISNLISQK